MFQYIKNNNQVNTGLVGVEIGISHGRNVESVLRNLGIEKYFLVDPYVEYVNVDGKILDFGYNKFVMIKRLRKFSDKYVLVENTSEDAIGRIPSGLDFVYIDGNHSYDFVKQDIELYYPKVKHGGVLGGHDFFVCFPGVCRAVLEFCNSMGYEVLHHKNDKYLPVEYAVDWWIVKK